jgi:hypothetical protein
MKNKWFTIIISCIAWNIYANDSWVESAGGSFSIIDGRTTNVQMISENIKITLFENYYEIDILFNFFNNGETIELNVGFPEYSYGTGTVTNIRNFDTSINNTHVDLEIMPNKDNSKIKQWYIKRVILQKNEYLKSRVKYQADYSNYGSYKSVEYLYGTGCTWKDEIKNITINIINHTTFWLNNIDFHTGFWDPINKKTINESHFPINILRKTNDEIEITVNNISPYKDDTFLLIFSSFPAFERPPYAISERRWILRDKIFNTNELLLLNNEQLKLLRNSIYAYHGYVFKSVDLQEYFNSQYWYKSNNKFNETLFSENEKQNIINILNEENRRK